MFRELIKIGPFTLYSYGLMMAAAFLVCVYLSQKDAKKEGVPPEKMTDCLLWVLIGGLIGARLLFVIINGQFYFSHPLKILAIRDGGMAVHGGLFGGFIAGWIACRVRKVPFLKMADIVAPYIALGQSIGRIGCFLNGCCYGRPIEKGLGIVMGDEPFMRMPVQIYNSLGLLLIYLALLRIRGKKAFPGSAFASYFIIYSIFRFFMEFYRGDNPVLYFNMTLAQLISAAIFVVSVPAYLLMGRQWKK